MSAEMPVENIPRPKKHSQFSILQLLVLLFQIGMFFALVTQLKHIGFVASCFVTGIVAGWWFRNSRWFAASVTALLVFVTSYLACWVQMGYGDQMHRLAYTQTYAQLERVHESLLNYAKVNDAFPDSLLQLLDDEYPVPGSGQILDGWEGPIHYEKSGSRFRLGSLGRDHKFGGVGLDADLFFGENQMRIAERIPLTQFVFQTAGSAGVFLAVVIASLLAGSLWFHPEVDVRMHKKSVISGVVATVVSSVFITVWLAGFHVAASQAGH